MDVRVKVGNRGRMAFVQLDDGTQMREVAVYTEVLEAARGKIVADEVLVVEGRVSNDEFSGGLRIIADRLMTLGEARSRFALALELQLNGEVHEAGGAHAAVERLHALLDPFRDGASCRVKLRYRNRQAEVDLPLGEAWRVRPDDALLDSLREWLPDDAVRMQYRT